MIGEELMGITSAFGLILPVRPSEDHPDHVARIGSIVINRRPCVASRGLPSLTPLGRGAYSLAHDDVELTMRPLPIVLIVLAIAGLGIFIYGDVASHHRCFVGRADSVRPLLPLLAPIVLLAIVGGNRAAD
jgi:hypothetical protein